MSGKVVVGYNRTGSATEAVMWAANKAELREVALLVVSCFDMPAMATEPFVTWGVGPTWNS